MFEWSVFLAFWIFCGAAARDWLTGRIPAFLLAGPMIIMVYSYPLVFFWTFVPIFIILVAVAVMLEVLERAKRIPPGKFYLGSGDALGLPLAMTISYAALPFWGLPVFAAVLAAQLPVFLHKKTRRLLPWLVPPATAALLFGFVL